MEVYDSPEARAEIIRRIREREFTEERTGIHQSDLNYCLNKQLLRRTNPIDDPAKNEQDLLIFSIGWATQRWLTGKDEDEAPIELDGIIVTLDSVLFGVPWELKGTYQSSNKPILENVHWIRQVMAQCKVRNVTEAYLSRFELLGDWGSVYPKGKTPKEREENRRASKRPDLHVFRFVFTPTEIEGNWEWLKSRRAVFAQMIETNNLLPRISALAPNGEYECDYCAYNNLLCFEKENHDGNLTGAKSGSVDNSSPESR